MEECMVNPDSLAPLVKPMMRLDATNCASLNEVLQRLAGENRFLIVDLSECSYLSSAGIRILLICQKRLKARQGELYLTGIVPDVLQVLEIAGLHQVFLVAETPEDARQSITKLVEGAMVTEELSGDKTCFEFRRKGRFDLWGRTWRGPDIAGYDELGLAVGFGMPAGEGFDLSTQDGVFFLLGNCAGFLPVTRESPSDYRISADPFRTGIHLGEALSVGGGPSGIMTLREPCQVTIQHLYEAVRMFHRISTAAVTTPFFMVIADRDPHSQSISVVLIPGENKPEAASVNTPEKVSVPFSRMDKVPDLLGGTFLLGSESIMDPAMPFGEMMHTSLTIENVESVQAPDLEMRISHPLVWFWFLGETVDACTERLMIDFPPELMPDPGCLFMVRRLYADSARVSIEPLHGGFSAQTFQVTSYDREGREMRPTVLKIAGKSLIAREAERCNKYSLPYIFNNSASVLGAEFFGSQGALRYNFVGIGGDESRLKWLTHYYHQCSFGELEPIFDNIFLHILKPWYQQPVATAILPFREHDPTTTFFPHINETVQELFSVTPDRQFIRGGFPERDMLNPYWYLKHEFNRNREWQMDYLTGICHGDLNMQNILLDEKMNVYLIDFSETRPRSVVSDFARLEAIFMVDNAPVASREDMNTYLKYIESFYNTETLHDKPDADYDGRHGEVILKNSALTMKMRQYAMVSTLNNSDPLPYYFSVLEWVLPVVCYTSMPLNIKILAMNLSGILCEKIDQLLQARRLV